MPRALKATSSAEPKTRRSAPVVERKRTPVRRKATPEFDAGAHYEEIAHLAYLNWLGRGASIGNPEQDWLEAEQAVRAKLAAV